MNQRLFFKGFRVLLIVLVCLCCWWVDAEATCLVEGCHVNLQQLARPHAPLTEDACDACHQETGEPHPGGSKTAFSLTAEGAELCLSCHDSVATSRHVHAAVEEGMCIECHDPHQPGIDDVNGVAAVCEKCHDSEPFNQPIQHGPVASGDCLACHDAHASEQKNLLKKQGKDLCFGCHQPFASRMAEATTVHAAIEGQGCTACHDAHGSSEKALLLEGMPELCFSCHDKVEDAALRSRKRHAALFREGSCAECHEVHASREKHLLPQRQDKVCLRCHGQEDTSRSNPLKNISAEIEGKKQVHGPLVEGECSACHQPHGGDNFRLLTKSYPETFYAPYEKGVYDFCLQCHEKNLLRYEETSLYTGFRNGKQNLHYLHVNNQRKGRTCRTCHGPHGSDVSHLLHEAGASFGDWNIPLKFVPNENGGSCTPGCHRQVQYDREQPVDYRQ